MGVPVSRSIAAEIAARIASGELPPGSRIPSTRQIMARYGVAMATASKVIAALREQGLVRADPGLGTVVTGAAAPAGTATGRAGMVTAAVAIADTEGLTGLSMRRLAGALGVPTTALYRYVADKDELLLLMTDQVMAGWSPPPDLDPARDPWRTCLEAHARRQWSMYRRHVWLAQAMSFTRPLLAPHAMAHTEWAMRVLDRHGLDPDTQFRAAVMLANHVRGTAVNLDTEAQAEQETGMTEREWLRSQQDRFAAVLATGRLPMMARYLAAQRDDFDLDVLFEFGLQRVLDGLAPMMSRPIRP